MHLTPPRSVGHFQAQPKGAIRAWQADPSNRDKALAAAYVTAQKWKKPIYVIPGNSYGRAIWGLEPKPDVRKYGIVLPAQGVVTLFVVGPDGSIGEVEVSRGEAKSNPPTSARPMRAEKKIDYFTVIRNFKSVMVQETGAHQYYRSPAQAEQVYESLSDVGRVRAWSRKILEKQDRASMPEDGPRWLRGNPPPTYANAADAAADFTTRYGRQAMGWAKDMAMACKRDKDRRFWDVVTLLLLDGHMQPAGVRANPGTSFRRAYRDLVAQVQQVRRAAARDGCRITSAQAVRLLLKQRRRH